ncbi:3-deoxy-manno-octulosonate cytidylyltransferase [Fuchsiella alkaliacetigena]|uniref:3-deoxy-manno-octulosonate cytidylyltransferase n=1 Tax=Fuchsiella alkaliacetigena TaxID=957042 RepID=UPI00200A7022|nr:3-deoxy-manno-octulosonate cytidylyltransferase [Fuchsiella alkaliacetigena]MCK8824276.1 3-deoxy-manno-octulosonate cytidylyltransferase [Fuchsiella alkaliacetigena]
MEVVGIIPARYASTRLPGKPLVNINGKTMVEHVYRNSAQARVLDRVIVATDDQRIKSTVEDFGGQALMTAPTHQTGTDRLAEAAAKLEAEIVVNIQGDEPLIKAEMIEEAVEPLLVDPTLQMATLKRELKEEERLTDPNLVKVVTDQEGDALYFSRARIPHNRGAAAKFYEHVGLYVYRRDFLLTFSELASTPLEKAESLEQLRALENGYRIKVVETEYTSIGVDTEEDLQLVREIMKGEQHGE